MMIESPSERMPSVLGQMPKLGQVVTKVSDLVSSQVSSQPSCQKRPSNFQPFISHSSYLCKDLQNYENQENNPDLITYDLPPAYDEVADPESIVQQIALKIEHELKEAKRTSLECGEVLVPCNLTHQIASDVITMSESEPCGLRGGVLFVLLSLDDGGNGDDKTLRRVGCVKIGDPKLVPTFEMTLTLKRTTTSWLNQVSNRLFRNFNGRSRDSIVISESYQLSKKKLYRDISA